MLQFGNEYRMEVVMAQPRQVMAARRALDVLGAFSAERPQWSVTEMSQHLGVHKSTMSRLLTTMEAAGFVRRAPNNGHYALGPRLLEMAALVLSRLDVRTVARPWLEELSRASQETVNLAVWDHDEAVNVDQVASTQPILYMGWIGRRTPAHASSTGKALLAYQPPEVIDRVLSRPLHAFTRATVTDAARLRQELRWIRECGYAIAEDEFQDGVTAVAAAILTRGLAAGVVSISAPTYRTTRQRKGQFVQLLTTAAREIGQRMEIAPAWTSG
jgi:IclR family transcriptional regulator, acetate operon repressor